MFPVLAETTNGNSGLWAVIFALSLVTLSLMLLRRRRSAVPPVIAPPQERIGQHRQRREVNVAGDELLIQLEETARRVSALVDTKFAKLDQVVIDADARIRRLEELLSRAPDAADGPATSGASPAAGERSARPAGRAPDEQQQSVYDLADAGLAALQIAQRLGMPLGEVEVILNLRSVR